MNTRQTPQLSARPPTPSSSVLAPRPFASVGADDRAAPSQEPYEREAEQVAGRVMQSLGTSSGREGPPALNGSSRSKPAVDYGGSGGRPLPESLRHRLGQSLGADLNPVRVHTDARADRLNRSLDSNAATVGGNIFFRQGAYQPESRAGQKLITHEAVHTVHQGAVEQAGGGGDAGATIGLSQSPLCGPQRSGKRGKKGGGKGGPKKPGTKKEKAAADKERRMKQQEVKEAARAKADARKSEATRGKREKGAAKAAKNQEARRNAPRTAQDVSYEASQRGYPEHVNTICGAHDAVSGRESTGTNRHGLEFDHLHPDLQEAMSVTGEQIEAWGMDNCAEVQAVHKLLHKGSDPKNIRVHSRYPDGALKPACENCRGWLTPTEDGTFKLKYLPQRGVGSAASGTGGLGGKGASSAPPVSRATASAAGTVDRGMGEFDDEVSSEDLDFSPAASAAEFESPATSTGVYAPAAPASGETRSRSPSPEPETAISTRGRERERSRGGSRRSSRSRSRSPSRDA